MADNTLFRAAMETYDNEGRHSEGVMAVVRLVQAETRKAFEADVERYPLMQRVTEQTELTRMADEDARRFRAERDKARADLHMAEVFLATLRARVDELDAKRSDPKPTEAAPFDPRTMSIAAELHTDMIHARCQLDCNWHMSFSTGAQFLATLNEVCAAHPCSGRPVTPSADR